jgi:di/tricarboxylate transporter
MSLWFTPSVSAFRHGWPHYSAVGYVAAAGIHHGAAVFAVAMVAKIAPPDVIFGGFASSAFWLVFSGFVLGIAIRKTGLADRAARALSARLTDSWLQMVASVVLLSYALAFVMPSNMGRIALLMPIVAAMAKRAGINDGTRLVWSGTGRWVWHIPACLRRFYPQMCRIW